MQYTYPPVQWVLGVLTPGIIQPGRDGKRSPPSTAKVKNKWRYTSKMAQTGTNFPSLSY